jgi:hypothetical protein
MRSHRFSRIAAGAALVVSCVLAGAGSARADEAGAEALFQEGLAAMKRNDYPVACEAFAGSNKADPSPGTQINLALCYEKQKKWASAWTWYRSAVGIAQQRGQAAREKSAEESATRVKPLIHYVVVSITEPLTNPIVKRDGAEVTVSIAGKDLPLPIDPGEHTFEVTASGKKPWSKVVQIADTPATEKLEVPKLENAPVEEKVSAAPANDYRPPVVVTNDGSTQRTVGIVVGAAGILAGIASAGVFILAKSEESERDQQRKNESTATGDDRLSYAKSAETHSKAADQDQLISLIVAGGGVVLVGVGAVLYFTAPKRPEKAAKTQLVPVVTPTFAGLGLGGSF